MMLNLLNSWRKEITVVGDMTPPGSDITPIPEASTSYASEWQNYAGI
jgi:hypothetical protein